MFSNLRSEAGGSSAPSSASPSARITSDMFQAAMLQVSVIYSLQIEILTLNLDLLHLFIVPSTDIFLTLIIPGNGWSWDAWNGS